jgi:hypothetical protein
LLNVFKETPSKMTRWPSTTGNNPGVLRSPVCDRSAFTHDPRGNWPPSTGKQNQLSQEMRTCSEKQRWRFLSQLSSAPPSQRALRLRIGRPIFVGRRSTTGSLVTVRKLTPIQTNRDPRAGEALDIIKCFSTAGFSPVTVFRRKFALGFVMNMNGQSLAHTVVLSILSGKTGCTGYPEEIRQFPMLEPQEELLAQGPAKRAVKGRSLFERAAAASGRNATRASLPNAANIACWERS